MIVLTTVFLLSHAAALVVYEFNRDRTIVLTEATDLADRIVGIVELSNAFPAQDREQILTAAETQFLAMFPEILPPASPASCLDNDYARQISGKLSEVFDTVPGHTVESCVRELDTAAEIRFFGVDRGFDVLITIHFPDGQSTTFHAVLPDDSSVPGDPLMLYLLAILVLSLLVAGFLILRVVAPLDRLARAAELIGIDIDSPSLSVEGPDEVRAAATALNEMHGRLQRQIHNQRDMLAAVSHDLRSCLTRLQLRLDLLDDDTDREGLSRVTADMHRMVQGVLDFVHGIATDETPRRLDLAALLQSMCTDLEEEGFPVTCDESMEAPLVLGRPTALRRGLQNLILNAVKYGERAEVAITSDQKLVTVQVRDFGPGIPEGHLADVIRPFYRVDSSRNLDSGGLGLGLAIVQNVIQSHGGSLSLLNLPEGGLLATIALPVFEAD